MEIEGFSYQLRSLEKSNQNSIRIGPRIDVHGYLSVEFWCSHKIRSAMYVICVFCGKKSFDASNPSLFSSYPL
jgi:hypothetical protein